VLRLPSFTYKRGTGLQEAVGRATARLLYARSHHSADAGEWTRQGRDLGVFIFALWYWPVDCVRRSIMLRMAGPSEQGSRIDHLQRTADISRRQTQACGTLDTVGVVVLLAEHQVKLNSNGSNYSNSRQVAPPVILFKPISLQEHRTTAVFCASKELSLFDAGNPSDPLPHATVQRHLVSALQPNNIRHLPLLLHI
jgi:hypothetical protein